MELKIDTDSSLADRVYLALEGAILTGQIKLGHRLLENEIAERLSISRAPLREAFRRLSYEGLAETIPRRGTYVVKPSRQSIVDLLQVREELECLGVRLAAERISAVELDELGRGLDRIGKQMDRKRKDGYPHHDVDFHQSVVRASGNEKLKQLMVAIYRQLRLVRLVSGARQDRAPFAYREHLSIFEALSHKNPRDAEKRMRIHLRASAESILGSIEE
jgi:DNA-binding GntR family transcriptional regulator